jgi:integral membrane sensor domain MASE1
MVEHGMARAKWWNRTELDQKGKWVQVVPIALTFVSKSNILSTSSSYAVTFLLFLLEFGPVLV